MITIIEGPDGAGKSTLADELSYRWPNDHGRHHQGPYYQNVLTETLGAVSRNLHHHPHVLCDRLHLGERIYGPVYRQHDMLGDAGQRVLERALLGLGQVAQVICYPPYESVEAAWLSREQLEMLDNVDQLSQTYQLYETRGSMLPTTVYDWTRHTVDHLANELITLRSPGNHGPGVGWFEHTSVLLVGEQTNGINVNLPGPPLPFVSTNGCGAWLSEKLIGVDEQWLYWVNALTPDGKPEDPGFIERLNPLGIIALGTIAHDWLTSHGFEHERLDHPQFAKRFHHGEPYPIKEAIDAFRR